MKRTVKKTETKQVETEDSGDVKLWIYLGRSPFTFNGRNLEYGQTFEAPESKVPKSFRDIIKRHDGGDSEVMTKPTKLRVKGGKYEVYDAAGKKVTKEPVSLMEANELLTEL